MIDRGIVQFDGPIVYLYGARNKKKDRVVTKRQCAS